MKKAIISTISKLTLVIALGATFMSVHAQSVIPPVDKTADIRYLGATGENLLFNVTYENPNGSKFSVIVLDQDGTPLFQEVYSEKKFDKRFRLPKAENRKVTFIVRDFKDADLKQSFEIDTRITEELEVTKVR
jgi:hypothetical protein